MDEDKDTKWDLPIGGVAEENLDKSTDDALKKVGGEPITTDIGIDAEGDDSTSEDLAFIDAQIKEDEQKKDTSSIDDIVGTNDLPKPPDDDVDGDITFGNYSDKPTDANDFNNFPSIPKDADKMPEISEASHEASGSLAELAEKFTAKKTELQTAISKSQAELDKISDIENSIKDLKEKEANLIKQASGLL